MSPCCFGCGELVLPEHDQIRTPGGFPLHVKCVVDGFEELKERRRGFAPLRKKLADLEPSTPPV